MLLPLAGRQQIKSDTQFVLSPLDVQAKTFTLVFTGAVNYLTRRKYLSEKGISIETFQADWKKLSSDLGGRTFDAILCLGSSLPYYKTWQEDVDGAEFGEAELRAVLTNFRQCLNVQGTLIVGLSRHINKQYSKTDLTFNPKPVSRSLSDARDDEYVMRWEFQYDWVRRRREWYCDIRNKHGDDYSFDLVSHLFDIHELHECCKAVFGATNARIVDPDIENYDMYVVCTAS